MRSTLFGAAMLVAMTAALPGQTRPEGTLADAVRAGDRASIRRLIDEPGAVNRRAPDGSTPLHAAVWADDAEVTGLLLRAGADANAANRYGVTPLSIAALNRSDVVVGRLLEAGADPNARLAEDQTALMAAARAGSAKVLSLLIDAGADVNARERVLGETALMWAALEDHGDAVTLLVKRGADVNARSSATAFTRYKFGDGIVARPTVLPKGGWTPLLYAARQNAMGAAEALADAGADLDATDPDGTSALVMAVINAHHDLAELLLRKGAKPNVADVTGMTPLYAAVTMHTLEDTVGRPNPRSHSRVDEPALVRALLAHGADPNARLKRPVLERLHNDGDANLGEGATPLMRAAKDADVELMRILLEHGADLTLATASGRTPLMFAAARLSGFRGSANRGSESDALKAVALCIERGANVTAVDASGQTALHLAALQAEDSVVKLLVEKGANVDARDSRGRTPLDLTRGGGRGGSRRDGTAKLLVELGASPSPAPSSAAAPAPTGAPAPAGSTTPEPASGR